MLHPGRIREVVVPLTGTSEAVCLEGYWSAELCPEKGSKASEVSGAQVQWRAAKEVGDF